MNNLLAAVVPIGVRLVSILCSVHVEAPHHVRHA